MNLWQVLHGLLSPLIAVKPLQSETPHGVLWYPLYIPPHVREIGTNMTIAVWPAAVSGS